MSRRTKTKQVNPVVASVAGLIKSIRESTKAELIEAVSDLQLFADSWLVEGVGRDLPGTDNYSCCLSDTDVTEAVKSVLEDVWIDLKEDE